MRLVRPVLDRVASRFPGGTAGNRNLTAFLGALLLVGILGEFATLVLGLQSTLPAHILLGVALIPIVALKLGSTGWRMIRYYTKDPPTDGKARHARSCAESRRSSSARPSRCSEVGLD